MPHDFERHYAVPDQGTPRAAQPHTVARLAVSGFTLWMVSHGLGYIRGCRRAINIECRQLSRDWLRLIPPTISLMPQFVASRGGEPRFDITAACF